MNTPRNEREAHRALADDASLMAELREDCRHASYGEPTLLERAFESPGVRWGLIAAFFLSGLAVVTLFKACVERLA